MHKTDQHGIICLNLSAIGRSCKIAALLLSKYRESLSFFSPQVRMNPVVPIFIFGLAAVSACPCPAGTHCLNGNSTLCRPCEENKYQNEQNTRALYCADCSPSCRQKEIVVQNCSKANDLICRCEPGYYKAPVLNGPCLPHNSCKAGFEEKLPGEWHMKIIRIGKVCAKDGTCLTKTQIGMQE